MIKKSMFIFLMLLLPALVCADKYSFTKFTWSKGLFLSSGTVCILSLVNGFYYEGLSDDYYKDYQNAKSEGYASSYKALSENYNTQSAFCKNMAIVTGSVALISAGLDYFIFGRVKVQASLKYESENTKLDVNVEF